MLRRKKEYHYEDVGERLRMLRGRRKQAEVAEVLGVTLRSYQYFESGERLPPLAMATKIAIYYDIPIGSVYEGNRFEGPAWEAPYLSIDIEKFLADLDKTLRAENRVWTDKEREFVEWATLFQRLRERRVEERAKLRKENRPLESMRNWLGIAWERASGDEKAWLVVQFKKAFPEYAEWAKDHGGTFFLDHLIEKEKKLKDREE
jgi:transcriptional regulator with XRE-family HTH domain